MFRYLSVSCLISSRPTKPYSTKADLALLLHLEPSSWTILVIVSCARAPTSVLETRRKSLTLITLRLICTDANGIRSIHGEISAINACTAVFTARNMTATQIYAAWADLSICKFRSSRQFHELIQGEDTNAESCPMCASAIRWSGFKEYVYGTTIQHNYNVGWGVITMSSYDVFQQTRQLPGYQTVMLGQALTNETDPLFSWQYNESYPCPNGCPKQYSKTRGYSLCVDPNAS